jgi:hypothetical protein
MITNQQLLSKVRHPEPLENLVESLPVKDGMKLSDAQFPIQKNHGVSWEDIRGLGWVFSEDWS